MTLCSKSGSVWRCSRMSWHTFTRRSFWSSSRSFGTIFAQIFRDNLPHAVTVDFQLICYRSNSQPTIATHHLLHALNIVCSPARWRPSTPRVIFHIFASLLEPLVPLKDTWAWHCLISVHFLQHSECIWWSFPSRTKNFRLIRCSVVMAWRVKFK